MDSSFAAWEGDLRPEFSDAEVHASQNLGFARFLVPLTGTMDGRPVDPWVRTTNRFREIDGEWLMIHDHVSMPVAFATGRTVMNLSSAKPFG